MSAQYARGVQAARGGAIEARYVEAGDVILIRRPGALDRTEERIESVRTEGRDVIFQMDGFEHRTSPAMAVRLTTESILAIARRREARA